MGNTCNKVSEVPSYDMLVPQTNQIPPQINRTLSQRSDLVKSRIKNFKKAKGFSQCEITPKERLFLTKFNTELIKQAQSAQVLTIKISPLDTPINKKLSRFFAKMRSLNQVKALRVSFESLSERLFRKFCQSLQYMKSLTCLEIELTRYASNTFFFPIFIPAIQSLKNLNRISLSTASIRIQDKCLPDFSRKLGHLTLLKRINLNIENSQTLQCASLTKMLDNCRNLNLSAIILKMKSIKFENSQLNEFLASFKHFTSSLEALTLNFTLYRDGFHLYDFVDAFKCLQNLKSLDLNLNLGQNYLVLPMQNQHNHNKMIKRAIKALARGLNLRDRSKLAHVKLELPTGSFSLPDSRSLISLIQKIAAADFRFLTDITYNDQKSIDFAPTFCLENYKSSLPKLPVTFNLKDVQEIPNFFTFLKPIQNLYSFHLSINWNLACQLHQHSIQNLVKNVQELSSSVSGLTLSMKKCHILDEAFFKKLCSCLANLQPVNTLAFDFTECIQVSDVCLASIGDMLIKMASLKRLSLVFDECYLIHTEGIKKLSARLLAMKSLEYVKINCDGCFNLNQNEKGLLVDLAISIPKSEIFLNKKRI